MPQCWQGLTGLHWSSKSGSKDHEEEDLRMSRCWLETNGGVVISNRCEQGCMDVCRCQ